MPTEKLANIAKTNLTLPISNSQTSINVNSGGLFPSDGNFRLVCDSEIMIATSRSGNNITVLRGQEGTVATYHNEGASVLLCLTAGSLNQLISDRFIVDNYSQLENTGLKKLQYSKDSSTLSFNDGTNWNHTFGLYPIKNPIIISEYTWFNQGIANSTQLGPTAMISVPISDSGTNVPSLTKPITSLPYTLTAGFRQQYIAAGGFNASFVIINDGTKFIIFQTVLDSNGSNFLIIESWNSTSSFNGQYFSFNAGLRGILYLRIRNNGSNRIYSISTNGVHYSQVFQHANSTHLNEVNWGFGTRRASNVISDIKDVSTQFFSVEMTYP